MIHGVFAPTAVGGDDLYLEAARGIVCLRAGIDAIGASAVGEIPLPIHCGRIRYYEASCMLERTENTGLRRAGYTNVRTLHDLDQVRFGDGISTCVL